MSFSGAKFSFLVQTETGEAYDIMVWNSVRAISVHACVCSLVIGILDVLQSTMQCSTPTCKQSTFSAQLSTHALWVTCLCWQGVCYTFLNWLKCTQTNASAPAGKAESIVCNLVLLLYLDSWHRLVYIYFTNSVLISSRSRYLYIIKIWKVASSCDESTHKDGILRNFYLRCKWAVVEVFKIVSFCY